MVLINESTISCASAISQYSAIDAIRTNTDHMVESYETRNKLIIDRLSKIGWLEPYKDNHSLYSWIKMKNGSDSEKYCEFLLNNGVVACPGTAFGVDGYIRLCCCNSQENIVEGIERILNAGPNY